MAASGAVAFGAAVVIGSAYETGYLAAYGIGLNRISLDAIRAAMLSLPVAVVLIGLGLAVSILNPVVDRLAANKSLSVRAAGLLGTWLGLSAIAYFGLHLHPLEAVGLPFVAVLVATAIDEQPPVRSVLLLLTILALIAAGHGYLQASGERAEPDRVAPIAVLIKEPLVGLAGKPTPSGVLYEDLALVFSDDQVWILSERVPNGRVWFVPRDSLAWLSIGTDQPAGSPTIASPSPFPSPATSRPASSSAPPSSNSTPPRRTPAPSPT
jgi:hypothetical protein